MKTDVANQVQVRDLLKALMRLKKILRPFNLKIGDYNVLLFLRDTPSGTFPKTIGKEFLLLPAAVTRVLTFLEGAKLITRKFGDDRRTLPAYLTEEGRSLLDRLDEQTIDLFEKK